jgi:hypothetical protein
MILRMEGPAAPAAGEKRGAPWGFRAARARRSRTATHGGSLR